MSGEITQDFNGNRPFEERVFARFDGIESFLRSLDGRVQVLESRSHDTKPIWERALKEILETGLEVGEVKSKVGVIESKVGVIESKVGVIESKVGVIESKVGVIESKVAVIETEVAGVKTEVAGMKTDYAGIRNELTDMKRELKHHLNQKLDLIIKFLLEDRDDIRDADERIKQLESKLA
jgi:chromosome segregation ATPase